MTTCVQHDKLCRIPKSCILFTNIYIRAYGCQSIAWSVSDSVSYSCIVFNSNNSQTTVDPYLDSEGLVGPIVRRAGM